MSTITLQNFRVGSDLTVKVRLKDGGVAIDWSTLSGIRAVLYSDAQSSIAGRCDVTVDGEDPTLLVCRYAATKMQYLGVNRIVVSAKYMGMTKTYDKPAFTFVRWTEDQAGEEITIEDPEVTVEIDVEDVSSSILQEAVDAAFFAADRANEAAEAAEHMVDIHTGPKGDKGDTGETPDISIGTVTTVEPGTPAAASMGGTPEAPVLNLSIPKGAVGATPNFTVGTVTTGQPGTPVVITITGTAEAPVLNVTIPQGLKGDTGVSADYPITIHNGLDSDATDEALAAAQGKILDGKVSQLEAKVDGLPEVEIDMTDYPLINGGCSGDVFYDTGNYGLYHRSELVPIGDYKGRTIRVSRPIDPNVTTALRVLKSAPVGGQTLEYATGYSEGVINIGGSNSPLDLIMPSDAEYFLFYIEDTRDSSWNKTPDSVIVLATASKFYTRSEVDGIVSEIEGEIQDVQDDVDGINSFQSTESATKTSESQGYVKPSQTVGNEVSLSSESGFGSIYTFNIPAGARAKVDFVNQSGNYGFALCTALGIVLEYTTNSQGTSYTFTAQENDSVLYASSSKLDSIVLLVTIDLHEKVSLMDTEISKRVVNRWSGRTIWWCGTSIPAGSDATIPGAEETIAGNYPKEVGNDLSATVVNKSVGGSMCRANVRTGDYNGANFSNITSALSMTKEEIENFITNYDTYKALSGNTSWPASLDATFLARLRAASFEDRLLPYLDGTYDMPDLFVIDHGHNDYKYTLSGGGSDIGLQPTVANIGGELAEDTFMTANNNAKLESFLGSLANIPSAKKAAFIASLNRNCYIGAVNFIVTLILKYNPHARILFISNYEYENGDQKGYSVLIPAQESLAKSWAFPLCEVYKYVGYSDHIIPGSMAWFNATYPAQTPATTDVTVYRAYLPDGVHPHSDITGDANNIYAGIISEFIKKIY